MQPPRQHILDTLDQRGSATARQLAQAFGLTAANLRRHLAILQARGLVTRAGLQPGKGRGRPETLYALTPAGQGTSLEALTRALLAGLVANLDGAGSEEQIQALAKRMLSGAPAPTGQLTRRLVATVQRLSALNYKPHWEAKPQGPELVLGRCPYATIIADHPELCRMDAHLLATLLGMPVEQTSKLVPGQHGVPQCVFVLQQTTRK